MNKVEGNDNTEQPRHGPPRSPWMTFPMLFMLMKTKLPQDSMDRLQQHYVDFKVNSFQFNVFLTHLFHLMKTDYGCWILINVGSALLFCRLRKCHEVPL